MGGLSSNNIILIFVCIFNWSLSTICLFYLKRFWELRQFSVITKRHHILVVGFNLCILEYVCLEKPLVLYWSTLQRDDVAFWIVGVLEDITFSLGVYGCVAILLSRVWLLSYDIHLALANSQKQWLHYLSSKIENDPSFEKVAAYTWYINHKNTLGNEKYLLWRIVIPCVLLFAVLTNTLTRFNELTISYLIKTVTLIILILSSYYVWRYKLPSYYDTIYARLEIKLTIYLGAVCLVLYLSYSLWRVIDAMNRQTSFFFKLLIAQIPSVIFLFFVCLSSTFVVLKWTGLDNFYHEYKFQKENITTISKIFFFFAHTYTKKKFCIFGGGGGKTRKESKKMDLRKRRTLVMVRHELLYKKAKEQSHKLKGVRDQAQATTAPTTRLAVAKNPAQRHATFQSTETIGLQQLLASIFRPDETANSINIFTEVRQKDSQSASNRPPLALRDMLRVMHRLEIFMDFLFHEFSHENLLGFALIEFTQFEEHFLKKEGLQVPTQGGKHYVRKSMSSQEKITGIELMEDKLRIIEPSMTHSQVNLEQRDEAAAIPRKRVLASLSEVGELKLDKPESVHADGQEEEEPGDELDEEDEEEKTIIGTVQDGMPLKRQEEQQNPNNQSNHLHVGSGHVHALSSLFVPIER
ncbi:hypothetical protein RFI_30442 [Reticulomyxa filosa]|uniref:RGS domain-containing protein n=1 Tax=Reticulomyxa filosa TaxID=46433 RepID=X6M1V2_RETFI|nr:hypothetical protein RFI_30442 [Reticulomyxa filosa]|eukprot:ETO06950.1 hypothetical protein RFI_30442 [Reticulomyxa filosa]